MHKTKSKPVRLKDVHVNKIMGSMKMKKIRYREKGISLFLIKIYEKRKNEKKIKTKSKPKKDQKNIIISLELLTQVIKLHKTHKENRKKVVANTLFNKEKRSFIKIKTPTIIEIIKIGT
ncbi:hypothetical protein KKA93_01485 [Patescibacteria group bacterium]|nr:hypothetical protein [Patescibacteria group bacterium]MBU1663625.1 hypothetical protein [Patescibacteria group bacterium]MBU1933883.1 hypothetical protein [Patescibacteria group bacterium]MBU2233423.1 hypothetical protein [Patescibacteria group bacterium]